MKFIDYTDAGQCLAPLAGFISFTSFSHSVIYIFLLKVPITPKNVFRFVKSLYGITKNAAKMFAIG